MKLQKKYLEILFKVLGETKPNLADARIRDRFVKELRGELETFYKERSVIIEKFCDKDKDGKPIITEDKYTFNPEVSKEVTEELEKLVGEEVSVPVSDALKVKSIIESTEYKPAFGEAQIIDEVLALIK